ncbi:putative GPI-anchored cell surface glycoprotein [Aspergillus affinis]|uniref:putative GPI-anchored cell surface glycoprotein n=1 Tax=Aspergillus affinis TaxID=1070780 RepID=UPI0022FEF52F|nr:uncharacterized protein KD926_009569 [Aspergillus affinis]KAI9045155.1 hypothetical protein KD926_009569 [Aspergillus affinis]
MSLNGLDNPAVLEAYQVALNEAGGWFLLHYVARDEVALFERGTGGVPEVRTTIDAYEEVSPLYGFLQYRRRKVVLSYLPEGLSRLVQARTTVQFQSILDKFSPHDTVFTLAQSSQLTESALSSACLLHTASGSITSSSSSLRRRRLMEIAEDAEENTVTRDALPAQSPVGNTRQRSFSQLSDATIVAPPAPSDAQPPPVPSDPPAPPAAAIVTIPETPATDVAQPAPSVERGVDVERASSRASSLRNFREELSHPLTPSESRKSTQSARPSLRDLELTGTYPQKVKRGPRPSVDVNGRPRTAGNLSRSIEQQRPVASLPAGIRSSSLRKTSPPTARPRSQGNTAAAATPGKRAPPVPPLLVPPLSTPISRPQISPGAKSLSALSSGTSHERERLMKALQLRRTQLEKKAQGAGNNKPSKAADGGRQQRQKEQPTTSPREDNKENREKSTNGDGKHEEKPAVIEPSRSLTPLAEPRPAPILATELMEQSPGAETAPLSLRQPTPEPAPTEIKESVSQEADEGPSDVPVSTITPTSTSPTQPSTDRSQISAKEASPEAQTTLRQPETDAGQADPALLDAKSGPGSPSAVVDVPPEPESLKAPEEIITPSPPAENPVISGALDDDATGESTASPIPPQSLPLPTSPSPSPPPGSSRPPSIPEIAPTVIASETPEPQHDLTAAAPEPPIAQQKDVVHRKDKRKPHLEPIQVPTPDYSDDDNFSDDSFMEELKSATVEEAKPISVGKSPLSPGYSNNGNERTSPDAWRNSRAVSNPSAIGGQSPNNLQALAVGRSVSTSYAEMDSATNPVLVAKKINVSSGISKRIKALEKFTGNAPSHSAPNLAVPPASTSFETLRKRASVSVGGHSDALSRQGSYSPEPFSRASSVRRPSSSTSAPRTTNSVSVTARIVRDSSPAETNGTPPESGVLNLQPSPLTVEHDPADPSPAAPSPPPESVPILSTSDKRSMSTSSAGSGPRSISPTMQRSESRLSISSASRNDRSADVPSSPEDKRESRTSRILRRMSSITSNSRKGSVGALSSPVKEEESVTETKTPDAVVEAPQAVDIGEVNVQFPDTLLWKRRFIRIDDKGFLVLTPGTTDSSNRNMIKRYHLSEFRTPCLPDEDCQELPNSILLEFLDGRTLQCACESRQGQAFVLQTLVGAHTTYQSTMA